LSEVYNYYFKNYHTKELAPALEFVETLEQLNENLSVIHSGFNVPLFSNREFIYLYYGDIFQEDNFAIVAYHPFDRPDVPVKKVALSFDVTPKRATSEGRLLVATYFAV